RVASVFVGACAALAVAAPGASASIRYGAKSEDQAVIYPGGPSPVLLLHEKGETATSVSGPAKYLQSAGFTVLDLEWAEPRGEGGIFPADTDQIKEAVSYVRSHARSLSVDPNKLTMVGGSRGALLSMLVGELDNRAAAGTVKAVVSLSGQVNPQASIERARRGELAPVMTGTLAQTFGCTHELAYCDEAYVAEWSPIDNVRAGAPAMFLAASEDELRAWPADQYEMAEALRAVGVNAEVVILDEGHGFGYFGRVREATVAFLLANS
ncbi:MAG TPA: alpha/beta hydrolase fold domain-containing protein, partial [Solirubrobacteraceae bacterium]|nr:alpha/beta hydrolase fold domain-containing protein [Solirubrobacteraceae bacterium]